MKKNTHNQDKYTGEDDIQSPVGFRRAHMKQMERIENAIVALAEIMVENSPVKKQKGLRYKLRDLLDNGELDDSVKVD